MIYFEGTYASTFSGNPVRTPLYDYNQIMYRLDLDDPRLNLPVPVAVDGVEVDGGERRGLREGAAGRGDGPRLRGDPRRRGPDSGRRAGRRAPTRSPPSTPCRRTADDPPPTTAPLYEFTAEDGSGRRYATAGRIEGYRRGDRPLCRVWRDPIAVDLPGD